MKDSCVVVVIVVVTCVKLSILQIPNIRLCLEPRTKELRRLLKKNLSADYPAEV